MHLFCGLRDFSTHLSSLQNLPASSRARDELMTKPQMRGGSKGQNVNTDARPLILRASKNDDVQSGIDCAAHTRSRCAPKTRAPHFAAHVVGVPLDGLVGLRFWLSMRLRLPVPRLRLN